MRTVRYVTIFASIVAIVSVCRIASGQCDRLIKQIDYVSVYSGWVFLKDYHGENEIITTTSNIGSFNHGWALGGAVGKYLSCGNRIEGEFSYRNNTGNNWSAFTTGPFPLLTSSTNWSGSVNSYSSMTNFIHDFQALSTPCITPYLGAGIGVAKLDGDLSTPTTQSRIHDTLFAYQGISGLKTKLTSRLSLLTEYRFFGTSKTDLVNSSASAAIGDFKYLSHNALIGLSWSR